MDTALRMSQRLHQWEPQRPLTNPLGFESKFGFAKNSLHHRSRIKGLWTPNSLVLQQLQDVLLLELIRLVAELAAHLDLSLRAHDVAYLFSNQQGGSQVPPSQTSQV